jgi:hypothetical protein
MSVLASIPIEVLLAAAVVLFLMVTRVALGLETRTAELHVVEGGLRDLRTGALTASSFESIAQAELDWGARDGLEVTMLVLRVHGLDWSNAVRRLRLERRGNEPIGLVGAREVAVLLWECGEAGAPRAASRLAAAVRDEGIRVVDAGWAIADPSVDSPTQLLTRAREQLVVPEPFVVQAYDPVVSAA